MLPPLRLCTVALGLLCVVPLCVCAVASAQNPPAQETPAPVSTTFKIAGVVVSSTTGLPLARSRVSVYDARNPRNEAWMVTREDGRFAFDHLPAGKYSLQGARRGFIPSAYEQHEQYSTAIVTGAGGDTENLTLRLVPEAAITGKILDESGEPVRNAGVRLFRQNHHLGFNRVTPFQFAPADDQGSYEFVGLPPGTYFLGATARPWYALHPPSPRATGAANLPVLVGPSLDVAYPVTFYQGATDSDAATPILIKGGDRAEIDVHLEPVPALHLIFRETLTAASDANGKSVKFGRQPVLERRIFDATENAATDTRGFSDADSQTLELSGVPAGKYTVRFVGPPGDQTSRTQEVSITKDGQDLDPSAGEPLASVKVAVRIAGENRNPQQINLILRDARMRVIRFQQIQQNGEIRFDDLAPGNYTLTGLAQNRNTPWSRPPPRVSTPAAR